MRTLALLTLMACLAAPALAQDSQPATPPAPEIDATKLGVDLNRIQRGLRIAESRERAEAEGLRVNFAVQVFGQAPRMDILQGIDLVNGAVPGTAPTHRQFIEQVTPQIYRYPGVDFFGLAIKGVQLLVEKSRKARCEEEIAAYRALLMQGVNVAAPRCTQ
jgi:hypothetical protein